MKQRKHSLNPRAVVVPTVAAAYVRRSTDQTTCSTEHQLRALRHLAKRKDFKLLRIFQESGGLADAAADQQ